MIRNLRSLTTYVQVVDSGSLSAAARALGLTLPMVSRDVARLEEDLGVVLIQRTTRVLLHQGPEAGDLAGPSRADA